MIYFKYYLESNHKELLWNRLVIRKRLPELNWNSLIKNVLFFKKLVTMKKNK
jgi:hypothetical protein